MSDKLYLVSEIGFDYDDNNYYQTENGGSHPRTAYKSQEKAKQVCDKLNISEFINLFTSNEIQAYGEQDYLVTDPDKCNAWLGKHLGTSVDDWWSAYGKLNWLVEPTDQDWADLYSAFEICWYTVNVVDMAEE